MKENTPEQQGNELSRKKQRFVDDGQLEFF